MNETLARQLAAETARPYGEVVAALRELDSFQLGDRDAARFIRQMAAQGKDVCHAARALHALPRAANSQERA